MRQRGKKDDESGGPGSAFPGDSASIGSPGRFVSALVVACLFIAGVMMVRNPSVGFVAGGGSSPVVVEMASFSMKVHERDDGSSGGGSVMAGMGKQPPVSVRGAAASPKSFPVDTKSILFYERNAVKEADDVDLTLFDDGKIPDKKVYDLMQKQYHRDGYVNGIRMPEHDFEIVKKALERSHVSDEVSLQMQKIACGKQIGPVVASILGTSLENVELTEILPIHNGGVGWHRDIPASANVWIAVSDNIDESNGAMDFLPGSQQDGCQREPSAGEICTCKRFSGPEDVSSRVNALKGRYFSVHDGCLVHKSEDKGDRAALRLAFKEISEKRKPFAMSTTVTLADEFPVCGEKATLRTSIHDGDGVNALCRCPGSWSAAR